MKTSKPSPVKARPSRAAADERLKPIRSYKAAISYLDAQVNYERRPPLRRGRGVFTLARMQRLLSDLGQPHHAFRSVQVAGTKGKGSTATMIAHMLANNNLTVGLYTSPHIMNLRERICVNDAMISESALTKYIARIADVSAGYNVDQRPTYFEILTPVPFLYFAAEKVDVAVLETGLGGRYDATNVVKPDACAITNISMDHMAQLGDTVEQIAKEKAGIFKSDVPVVCAPQPKNIKKVLRDAALESNAKLFFAGEDIRFSYRFEASRQTGPQARICVSTPTSHFDHLLVPLLGEHQAVNCGVALGVIDQLKGRGFKLDDEASIAGLAKVRLQGRMEMVCEVPRIIADGAHNAASIDALMRAIGQNIPYDSMVVIFGCCSDKDIPGMLQHIQLGADKVIFTRVDSPRSADPAELAVSFSEISGRMAQTAPSLEAALEIAEKAVTREDLICVTGSFILVGEAKDLFAKQLHRATTGMIQNQ